jgi:hypothetical protein
MTPRLSVLLLASLIYSGCGNATPTIAPTASPLEKPLIAESLDGDSFKAALLGEWTSAWNPEGRPYITHILITPIRMTVDYVSDGTHQTIEGPYSVTFLREPRPHYVTLADITIAPATGNSFVLSRVSFGHASVVPMSEGSLLLANQAADADKPIGILKPVHSR